MFKRALPLILLPALLAAGGASAQEYPMLDDIANRVIAKYQSASCEQLFMQKGQPQSAQEQEAIQILRGDPQMQQVFFNKVAAPIVSKMFQCGLVP